MDLTFQSQRGVQQLHGIGLHGLVARQTDHRRSGRDLIRCGDPGCAGNVRQRFSCGAAPRRLQHGPFSHAVDQQIGLGVQQNGTAESVRPEVVMGDPAQRCLDAAQNHGKPGKRPADEIGVDDAGPIGAGSCLAARRIGVVMTFFAEGRVVR